MSKFSIKQQLVLLLAVLMAVLLLVAGVGLRGITDVAEDVHNTFADRVMPMLQLNVIDDAYGIEIPNVSYKTQSGKLEWGPALARVEEAEAHAKAEWEAYTKTYLVAEEIKLVNDMRPLFQAADQAVAHLKDILRAHDRAALEKFVLEELYPALDPIAQKINEAGSYQVREAKATYLKSVKDVDMVKWIFALVVLAGTALALLLGYWILRAINVQLAQMIEKTRKLADGDLSARIEGVADNELGRLGQAFNQMADSLQELVGKVQRSGIQVASSATEIAASVKEQQASATEQAATTVQIVASTKEIASTAKVLVKNMDEVAHGADETSALAEGGHEDLVRMEATMKQMMEATQGIAARLAVLSEKAGNISSVVSTINKVADQTNLLSLNAAIEAEKAGEHGIGFGVVATEIRRLADQTAIATWDIEQMVKEMQSAVSSGVMGMEKFSEEVRHGVAQVGQVGERLSKIVKSIQQLTPHFESVYQSMQAQSVGADQINQAIEQVNQTVQGTAQAMRESSSVVNQLNEASQRLQAAVAKFKIAG